ncbi:hypothetical protein ACFXDO_37475 [Streptomyces nigra]|uniref:hypothetical protein n=1 Tax=Streptomyces nigra TaxID=1827580 RepID=UPI0036A84D9C
MVEGRLDEANFATAAAYQSPVALFGSAEDVQATLLAALCSSRQAQITNVLVDLLAALIHKISSLPR